MREGRGGGGEGGRCYKGTSISNYKHASQPQSQKTSLMRTLYSDQNRSFMAYLSSFCTQSLCISDSEDM